MISISKAGALTDLIVCGARRRNALLEAAPAAVRLGERVSALVVIGGALRWRPESGPVFEERVRLARAGRMEEIAETVARTGLSERCRAENPALQKLTIDRAAACWHLDRAAPALASGVIA